VGVQFRPAGAAALLRIPGGELAERHTALEELWDAAARLARERLLESRGPSAALARLEELLVARLGTARAQHPAVLHAIARLDSLDAESAVGGICREAGLSRRRLLDLFRREVGLPPRRFARVRRFQRALSTAARGGSRGWAFVAAGCGFYDQSHLIRDFHAFAGFAPGRCGTIPRERPSHLPLPALPPPSLPSNPAAPALG
jgi:transcriptional regulator GlxA family with amidase domain